jgi:hypothetical protein
MTDLRLLRAKAIAQNNDFQMVFTANSNTYRAERFNIGTGLWEHYALYKHGSTVEGSARPISLPSSVQTTTAVTVTFAARGTVATTGSPPLTMSVSGRTRRLAINIAGLITIS